MFFSSQHLSPTYLNEVEMCILSKNRKKFFLEFVEVSIPQNV